MSTPVVVAIPHSGSVALTSATSATPASAWAAGGALPINSNGSASTWVGVAFSPSLNLFVALAASFGNNNTIATSPDGVTWTGHTVTSASSWVMTDICWADTLGLFVVIGTAGPTTTQRVLTSPDGVTWTAQVLPTASVSLYKICWSHGLGLLCAIAGTGAAYTSPDGITWTQRTLPSDFYNGMVGWAGGTINKFFACASNGWLTSSTDGITWITHFAPNTGYAYTSFAYSSTLGIAAMVGGNTGVVQYTTNGTTWVQVTSGLGSAPFNNICWSAELGMFVAVGNTAADDLTSSNGTTWTLSGAILPASQNWNFLAAGVVAAAAAVSKAFAAFIG